jgi:TolA-binding protein
MPGIHRGCFRREGNVRLALLTLVLLGVPAARGQGNADQAAEALLSAGTKAHQEKNFAVAVARYKEFLSKYANHKKVSAARHGLALALLDGPDKDFAAAAEQLRHLADNKDFAERPSVLYHLALAQRGLGLKELAQATPQDRARRQAAAHKHFAEAAAQFMAAAKSFAARVKAPDPRTRELPVALEWAARAHCDQAEMLLRLGKTRAAQTAAAPFLKDKIWKKSRYRGLGLYYHGFASFLRRDYHAAGKSLNMLTPFADSVYATHARYLLARTHHLQEELAEAAGHYEGVLSDYARFKQQAAEALKQPDRFKDNPEEKARLEALTRDPPPDHIARAAFFSGELLYEAGKFADALTRFAAFPQQHAGSTLVLEAQLRQGLCQVQLRQFTEGLKTLQPLVDKVPALADQALRWIARAQVGGADPANAPAYAQALKTALDTFGKAAEKARLLADRDPQARSRRGEILFEMGDTQQLARDFKGAAATYAGILKDKLLPRRDPEVLQRRITALHLAGDYAGSDKLCTQFREKYPKNPLLAAVLFRHAENAYFQALAAEKDPKLPDRAKTLAALAREAVKRYQEVTDQFPEFIYANQARYGQGMVHYRRGEYEKAQKVFEGIAEPDRKDDLVLTSYLLADCLIRLAPTRADDALAAGKVQEKLQEAAGLLDNFIGAQPNGAQTPDALLKLGHCHQRMAGLLAKPEERTKVLTSARTVYEKLINQFPKHALRPQAVFERARCLAQAGDKQGAVNEFRRFTSEAELKAAAVAPLGSLQLAILLREQNKAEEAVRVLEDCRKQHEEALLKDKERAGWVVLLQYQQGMALKEAGKFVAAREVLDGLIQKFPTRPEAVKAVLRRGQCLKEEALVQITEARKKLALPNAKPEELAAGREKLEAGLGALRKAARYLEDQAEKLREKQPESEVRARLLYDAAWGYRELAEPEIAAAQDKLRRQLLKNKPGKAGGKDGDKRPAAVTVPADIALKDIKLQPAEKKARALFTALIEDRTFAELPLANFARLELAELHAQRGEHDEAVKLLEEAIDKEPPADLTETIRVRLGTCLAAKKDFKTALAHFDAVAQNPKSPLLAQAQYRAGECLLGLKDAARAAARLAPFRDQPAYQNLPGLTDRALLRLGHALGQLKQWDQSKQAHEQVVGRFPNSPWVHEARFGIGNAIENKAAAAKNKQEYENAVNAYTQVTAATATEVAARAQFQIGLCRLAQERYAEAATAFLVVPFTYDYPEWNAAALCEAARAYVEDKIEKKPEKAEKLLRRVIREHSKSQWARVARKRLKELKKD